MTGDEERENSLTDVQDIACASIPGHANQMVSTCSRGTQAAEFESRTPGVYGWCLIWSIMGKNNPHEVSEPWLLSMVNAFVLPENRLELKSVISWFFF